MTRLLRVVVDRRRPRGSAASAALRGPPRDRRHLDVGVQRPQDRHRARAQRAGAVHDRPPAGRRRVAGDRVERHRERVGEHRHLVGHVVGDRHQHVAVGGQALGEPAGRVGRVAGVDARRQRAVVEAPAQAEVAGLARGADRIEAAHRARQPRVQHHPLPGRRRPRRAPRPPPWRRPRARGPAGTR